MFAKDDMVLYLDDNNEKKLAYVEVTKITDHIVEFKAGSKVVTLPMHRVLKIKRGGYDE